MSSVATAADEAASVAFRRAVALALQTGTAEDSTTRLNQQNAEKVGYGGRTEDDNRNAKSRGSYHYPCTSGTYARGGALSRHDDVDGSRAWQDRSLERRSIIGPRANAGRRCATAQWRQQPAVRRSQTFGGANPA